MPNFRMVFASLCAAALIGCGSGEATEVNSEADGTMTAQIDPSYQWSASKSIDASLQNGELVIIGTEHSGRFVKINVRGVVVDTAHPNAVQTFNIAAVYAIQVGFAQYSETGSDFFSTTLSGGSGTVEITTLTATHAVGTFTFAGVRSNPVSGGPGQQDLFRRLSAGHFDVQLR